LDVLIIALGAWWIGLGAPDYAIAGPPTSALPLEGSTMTTLEGAVALLPAPVAGCKDSCEFSCMLSVMTASFDDWLFCRFQSIKRKDGKKRTILRFSSGSIAMACSITLFPAPCPGVKVRR
jgi:hypothetical protein